MDSEGLEDGDALDAIQNFSERQTIDEEFNAHQKSQGSRKRVPRKRRLEPGLPVTDGPIKKLADEEWRDHFDDPEEERATIRRALDGDPAAKLRVTKCFHKTAKAIAGQPKYSGPAFEDRLQAAWGGFWKGLKRINLNYHNRTYAFVWKYMDGAVADLVHDWHRKGSKGETREERKDRSGNCPVHVHYNGVEERNDSDGAPISGWIEADDKELREIDGGGGKVTDAAWAKIEEGRKVSTHWCPNHRRPCCPPEPCKKIEWARYEEDQARAHRFDTAAFIQRRLSQRLKNIGRKYGVPRECFGIDEHPHRNGGGHPPKLIGRFQIPCVPESAPLVRYGHTDFGEMLPDEVLALPLHGKCILPEPHGPKLPLYLKEHPTPERHKADAPKHGNAPALGIIGYLAKDADLRNLRRLAKIGRRKYALELTAKDRTSIEPLFDVTEKNYSVPVNTHDTAQSPSKREDEKPADPHPLVWDEKDRLGMWRRVGQLPEHHSGDNPKLRLVALTQAAGKQRDTQTHSSTRPWDDVHRIDRSDGRDNRQTSRGSS
jgi:hypothetical protein